MNGRLNGIRGLLKERKLDAVLVSSPANRFYFSGFLSDDDGGQTTAALLVDEQSAVLMTGATNLAWAEGSAQHIDVREWSRPWPPFVAKLINDAGWRRVGIEDNSLTVASLRGITSELGTNVSLAPLGSAVSRLRRAKDVVERSHMAEVIAITDRAFTRALTDLIVGITEREYAWSIDKALRDEGADGSAFPTIVASGSNASRPHHSPSHRHIEAGEPVIIDMGARLDGYNGDLTRTVWLGDASGQLQEIFNVVRAAHVASWNAVKAGASAKGVHEVAENIAAAAGYKDNYLHGTGHGLGIDVHEAPSCGAASDDVLQVGDLITIEPGIYLSGWGGVRIEDVGIIEEDGFRRLTGVQQQRL